MKHMKSLASLDTEEYTKYLYNLKYKQDDPKLSEEEKQPTHMDMPKDQEALITEQEREYDEFWKAQNQGEQMPDHLNPIRVLQQLRNQVRNTEMEVDTTPIETVLKTKE